MAHGDAELGEPMPEERESAAIERQVGQDLIARANERPDRGRDRPHARGGRECGLAALEAGEPPLEQRHGRIADPAIDIAGRLAGEAPAAFAGTGKGEVEVRCSGGASAPSWSSGS
jgi:hypothetical protein